MPLPALLVNPWTLGIIGSMLPSVASAVVGAKSKDEAQAILAPKRHQMVAALIAKGADPMEAEQQTDAALESELVATMQEGALPAWAEIGLGAIGGGLGGIAGGLLRKGGMGALKDTLLSPFPAMRKGATGQRPPPAAVTRETPDPEFMRRRRNAKAAEAEMGQRGAFDQPYSRMPEPGEERGLSVIDPRTVTVDEIIPPFPTRRRPALPYEG